VLTREYGFALFLGYGVLLQAGAMTLRGEGEAAFIRIHEGMATMQATGVTRPDPMTLGYLAEAVALKGAVTEGLQIIASAFVAAEVSGTHWADPELHRLRGNLLRRLPSHDLTAVETCFPYSVVGCPRTGHPRVRVARRCEPRGSVELGGTAR
jgi:predicted ATPase